MNEKNRKDGFNEQDIFTLFNDVQYDGKDLDGIEVNLNDLQKRRLVKNLKKRVSSKRSNTKRTVAAVAGAVLLLGVFTINPVLAENVPLVGSIIQAINDRHGIYKNYDEYAQVVNKKIGSNGIEFTINDVLCDGCNLIVTYTIKSHRNLQEIAESEKVSPWVDVTRNMRVNGKRYVAGGSGISDFIDGYTYSAANIIHLDPFKKLPEKFDVDLRLREIFGIKGRWDVAFTVSKEEISKKSTVFEVNKQIDFENSRITIDKVTFTPVNTSIVVSGKYNNPNFEDKPFFDYDYWFVFDDCGNYLENTGGGGGAQGGKFYQSYYLEPLDQTPKYLTVIPCDLTPSMSGGTVDGKPIPIKENKSRETVRPLASDYPLELKQGDFGKLVIEKVSYEKDKTVVIYTAHGVVPLYQAGVLFIRNGNGDYVGEKGPVKKIGKENGNYKFVREFEPVNPDESYSFFTTTFDNYKVREDLKFIIELKDY